MSPSTPVTGPLHVLPENPRFFADASGRAVFLTGSHTWSNFRGMGPTDPPEPFDFAAYLDFLVEHNHNFFRLWAQELPYSAQGHSPTIWYRSPFPWPRTGPGLATDGKPKFDLSRHEQSFFDRMRACVAAARDRGVYVCIMLFDGYGPQFTRRPDDGFPFDGANNANGIACDGKESQSLADPAVTAVQEAYLRTLIDSVNDLDNVLYEVANEAGAYSTAWQYHVIRFVKEYEATKPAQHPIGMTFQYEGGTMQALWDSDADWISPFGDEGYGTPTDPPLADGRKVIVNDTDHSLYYVGLLEIGLAGQRAWAWKAAMRGHYTLFMDPYLLPWEGRNYPDNGRPDPQWEELRRSMGDTRRYAERLDLNRAEPSVELASSRYCLAVPGEQYLVYLPEGGSVTVDLSAAVGELAVEWFDAARREVHVGGAVRGGGEVELSAPSDGDAVLWLWRG